MKKIKIRIKAGVTLIIILLIVMVINSALSGTVTITDTAMTTTDSSLEVNFEEGWIDVTNITLRNQSLVTESGYVVWTDETTYWAKNGTTGTVQFSGTNCTDVIQRCLDNVTYGKGICLKNGNYTLVNPGLKFRRKCIDFYGESMEGSVLKLADNSDCNMITVEATATDFHFHDFSLRGNSANQASGSGIFMADNQYLNPHISHMYINYCKDYGIWWAGGDGTAFGVYVEYSGDDAWVIDAKRNTFTACSSWAAEEHGFYIMDDENTFTNCISSDSDDDGVRFYQCEGNTWTGGIVRTNDDNAFGFYGASNTIVSGTIIHDNCDGADNTEDVFIIATSDVYPSVNNTIIGCNIYTDSANKPRYIYIEADADQCNNTFVHNNIQGWSTAAVLSTSDTVIKDNIGYTTESNGLCTIDSGANSVTVNHNMSIKPTIMLVTPRDNLTAASFWYVNTITSTQFTLYVNAQVTSDVGFWWKAEY